MKIERQNIVLTKQDIANQYVDLPHTVAGQPMVFCSGLSLVYGDDFVVHGKRIFFANSIAAGGEQALEEGEVLSVQYTRLV